MKITACMWSQRQSSSAFRLINDASNDPDCLSAAFLSMYWHNWIHFGLMCSSVCPLRHCSWFPALQHAWIYTFFSTCMLIYCLRRHILSCRNIPLNKPSETQAEEQRMISLSDVSYDCFLFFRVWLLPDPLLSKQWVEVSRRCRGKTTLCSHQYSLKCKEKMSCIKECCRY